MKKLYDITISILALSSVALAILDVSKGLSGALKYIDFIIYFIFLADYIIRFILAKNKKLFFKQNVLDLVAILPFNSALRAFRVAKVAKVSRLVKFTKVTKFTKFARMGAVVSRFLKRTRKFFDTNGLKYVLLLTSISVIVAAALMTQLERMRFQDALWWSFVTATTVGYGDLSPETHAGRIIACVLMLIGIGLVGSLTSTITSFFLAGNEADQSEVEDIDNSKIKMCMVLYNELNDQEKEEFIKKLKLPE